MIEFGDLYYYIESALVKFEDDEIQINVSCFENPDDRIRKKENNIRIKTKAYVLPMQTEVVDIDELYEELGEILEHGTKHN